ncbi:MAG: TolC family protein [Pyrinomonadaceae bacterium]|nr:TolC family protein [Pyrinomonadaceae bacterium]
MIYPTQILKSLGAAGFLFFATAAISAQTPQNTPPPTPPTEVQQQNPPPQQQPPTQPGQTTRTQTQTQQTQPQNQANPQNQPTPLNQTPAQNQTPTQTQTQTQTTTTNPAAATTQPTQSVGTSGGVAPAVLPDDPPPVAPNFEAPIRPLPSAERVGVDVSDQLPLSLPEAITLALQNNNDIDSSRIGVQIAEFELRAVRGVYDPVIVSENYYERRTTPTASTIGGAAGNGSVTQSSLVNGFNVTGFSPFAGGLYQADFSGSRTTTDNQNATLNPQFPSILTLTYTQPLWRGFRFDNNRRTIEIAKKNLSLTDAQFRQRAVETIAQVETAYWDLIFSLRNLQVQIDAVRQARTQLESNQRLVQKGALAPIEIVSANTQITTFEQNVYTAQESVTQAENVLKTLMLPDTADAIWKRALVPVSSVEVEIPSVSLETAIAAALTNRQELAQLKTNSEINRINERYFRDQTKPQIDLVGSYTANGLAGTAVPRVANTTNSALTTRVNELSALNGLPPLPTTTTTGTVTPNLVGGYFKSLSNLATADYPTYRVGVTISLPLRNRTAKANLGRNLVEADQIKNQTAQQEQTIESDVRNALQALRSSEARLQAALATRLSAEQLYESEQRLFRAGTSTVFLVQQRQITLVTARGNELQAQTLLNKAVSGFQRATGTTLSANSVEITDKINDQRFKFNRQIDFGSGIFRAKKDD